TIASVYLSHVQLVGRANALAREPVAVHGRLRRPQITWNPPVGEEGVLRRMSRVRIDTLVVYPRVHTQHPLVAEICRLVFERRCHQAQLRPREAEVPNYSHGTLDCRQKDQTHDESRQTPPWERLHEARGVEQDTGREEPYVDPASH